MKIFTAFILLIFCLCDVNASAKLKAMRQNYPRIANVVQCSWAGDESNDFQGREVFKKLSRYDLVVVDADAFYAEILRDYLGPNPVSDLSKTIVMAYFSPADYNQYDIEYRPVLKEFSLGFKNEWLFHDTAGNPIKLFPQGDPADPQTKWTYLMNPDSGLSNYIPKVLQKTVVSKFSLDGILYDWASSAVPDVGYGMLKNIDINNDKMIDSAEDFSKYWVSGYKKLLLRSYRTFSKGTAIMGNCGWNAEPVYKDLLSGCLMESFNSGTQYDGLRWHNRMQTYLTYCEQWPSLSVIMVSGENDAALMRYGIASALMGNGYFCATNAQTESNDFSPYLSAWWYDEFAVNLKTGESSADTAYKGYLGKPLKPAYNAFNISEQLSEAVTYQEFPKTIWRRDFENGSAFVNPSDISLELPLVTPLKKIKGIVDPQFNNGKSVSNLILPPHSGAVFLNQNDF